MKRLLVTGADGFLGWHVCRMAAGFWRVIGTSRRTGADTVGCERVCLDLTALDDLEHLFSELRPDAVIHTAAAADPNVCETHPDRTEPINVDVPAWLAGRCARRHIPFVFTSSDLVFDGEHAPYAESAVPSPVNVYGGQKARAETAVRSACAGALVCRMPLLFGWSGSTHKGFDHEMIRAIRSRTPLVLFTDEFRTPVDAQSAAAGLLRLPGRAAGILHLGGRQRTSRFDMGMRFARHLGVSRPSIQAGRKIEAHTAAARPRDVSLVSRQAYRLGFDPMPMDRAIEATVRRAASGSAD
jgi:dTDP-4-dehydrorhamnose reductase